MWRLSLRLQLREEYSMGISKSGLLVLLISDGYCRDKNGGAKKG
jgi:hypothetical protein